MGLMPVSLVTTVILILASVRKTHTEVFSSILQFEKILQSQRAVADNLQDLLGHERDRLEKLRTIAAEMCHQSSKGLRDPEVYLGNPMNALMLLKRFTVDWPDLEALVANREGLAKVYALPPRHRLPTKVDFLGAAHALIRLQDTYALSTEDLARGDILGLSQTKPFTGDDCFELGHVAYDDADWYHAVLWMTEALRRQRAEGATNATLAKTLSHVNYAVYLQGDVKTALKLTNEWLEIDPHNQQALTNKRGYERLLDDASRTAESEEVINPRTRLRAYHRTNEFDRYERLCRGEEIEVNPYRDAVYCHYKRPHPYYLLRPLKEEVLYLDPFVAVYHDIMTDAEIDIIKAKATPQLHRSGIISQTGGPEEYRISHSAWVTDRHGPEVRKLSLKVSHATGLSLTSAEEFQVLNYGLGGHYEPHVDWTRSDGKMPSSELAYWRSRGNRISTSLFYMSDVAAGGGTSFPVLGIHVRPQKGMMLHWYNLHHNGSGDERTIHAGCPVLLGNKWVCNKWLHARDQELRRLCTLNPRE